MKNHLLFIVLFIVGLSGIVRGQTFNPQNFSLDGGFVNQLLRSNDTLFGVGTFSMSGYRLGSIIRYKGADRNTLDGNIPFFESGEVTEIEPDGNGGWFVGTWGGVSYNGRICRGVVHIRADFSLDTTFALTGDLSSSVNVYTIKLHNGILYAGGIFTFGAGPFQRPYLAACNLNSNQLIAGFNPGFVDAPQQYVRDIEVHGNKLLVGGAFHTGSGQPASCLATLNLQTGGLIHNFNLNDEVKKIVIDADTLIAGGSFNQAGGANRSYLAKFNLITNALMPFSVSLNNTVYDLCLKDTSMYIGGWFSSVNSTNRNGLAKINRYKGTVDPAFTVAPNEPRIQCLNIQGSKLLIGGNFQSVNGIAREYLAEIDLVSLQVTNWDGSVNTIPTGIKVLSGDPIIYGNLDFMQRRNNGGFFALNLNTRKMLSNVLVSNSFSASFNAIAKSGRRLFIAGAPTTVNGTQTSHLFSVNLSTGSVTNIGTFTGGNVSVGKLLVHNGKLYVYGLFTQVNGIERQRFAAFKVSDLSLDSWNADFGGSRIVTDMAAKDDKIFIVGDFYPPGSQVQHVGASLNANTGAWITGLRDKILPNNNDDYRPSRLLLYNNSIYMAGYFVRQFNPQLIFNAVVKMNEQFQLDPNFNAPVNPEHNATAAIGLVQDNIVAYAKLGSSGETNRMMVYSPLGGELLKDLPFNFSGSAPFTFTTNNVASIIYHDSLLFVGGNWDRVNGNRVRGLAVFDGRRFQFPTVSIRPLGKSERFFWTLYPNPAQDVVKMKWDEQLATSKIVVTDLRGKRLMEEIVDSGKLDHQLYIAKLQPGIYTVTIITNQGLQSASLLKSE